MEVKGFRIDAYLTEAVQENLEGPCSVCHHLPANRKVRFDGKIKVIEFTLYPSERVAYEDGEIWWTIEDTRSFRDQAKVTARQCPPIYACCLNQVHNERSNRRGLSDTVDHRANAVDPNLNVWCIYNGACRGLELMSSAALRSRAQNRRGALLSRIVRSKGPPVCEEEIRRLSQQITGPARALARQLGRSDAVAAGQPLIRSSAQLLPSAHKLSVSF